jgi:hypothetical protein
MREVTLHSALDRQLPSQDSHAPAACLVHFPAAPMCPGRQRRPGYGFDGDYFAQGGANSTNLPPL